MRATIITYFSLLCFTVNAQTLIIHTAFVATGGIHNQIGGGYNLTIGRYPGFSYGFAVSGFYGKYVFDSGYDRYYGINTTAELSYGNALKAGVALSLRYGNGRFKAFCSSAHCNDDTYNITEPCVSAFVKYQPFNKKMYLRLEAVPVFRSEELLETENAIAIGAAIGYSFQ